MAVIAAFSSCKDDYQTYAEQREHERKLIKGFMARGCTVIDPQTQETLLHVDPIQVTKDIEYLTGTKDEEGNIVYKDMPENLYVAVGNDNYYINIVRRGHGKSLQAPCNRRIHARYKEYSIEGDSIASTNLYSPSLAQSPEEMLVTYSQGTFSGAFTNGLMYQVYGTTVPQGWLLPLEYIQLARPNDGIENIALVRVIVPSDMGHELARQAIIPYFYEISFTEADR